MSFGVAMIGDGLEVVEELSAETELGLRVADLPKVGATVRGSWVDLDRSRVTLLLLSDRCPIVGGGAATETLDEHSDDDAGPIKREKPLDR